MPRISILISALNAEPTLSQALDSLRAQTWTDWECRAIDDGSSDRTPEIFQRFSRQDTRFKLVRHETARGLTASLIEAAASAEGDFLARQDADDWSEPERLSRQMALLEQDERCAGAASPMAVHFPDGRPLDTVDAPTAPGVIRRMLPRRNPFAHGSLLLRRSTFERIGGYRARFRYAQDYDLLLRLSEVADLRACDAVLYHHRLSSEGIGRARRVQQAAYADLARRCARARREGGEENVLLDQFHEPDAATPDTGVDPILLHLIKSGQKEAAISQLTQWRPADAKGKNLKRGLSLLNASPSWLRRYVLRTYRLWQQR